VGTSHAQVLRARNASIAAQTRADPAPAAGRRPEQREQQKASWPAEEGRALARRAPGAQAA
jgi:hypothetical protein